MYVVEYASLLRSSAYLKYIEMLEAIENKLLKYLNCVDGNRNFSTVFYT